MGASSGGVSVKLDSSKYELVKIVQDLFGNDFVESNNYEDIRYPDKYYLVKTKNVITIYNAQFVEKFYSRQDTNDIQYFVEYFQKPELIFAHERYDSGGTYSYSLIYNGEVKRQFRSLSYETKIDFGELEEVEKDWRDGEVKKFDLGDGDFETIIKNRKTGFECDEANIPQVILDQLQFDKLGFDDDDSKIIDKAFFIKVQKTTEKESSIQNDDFKVEKSIAKQEIKPWWKFW
jgi:hypothetical protein